MTDLQAPTRPEQGALAAPTAVLAAPDVRVPAAPMSTLLPPPTVAAPGSVPLVAPNDLPSPSISRVQDSSMLAPPDPALASPNVPFGAPPVVASVAATLPASAMTDSAVPVVADSVTDETGSASQAAAAMMIPSLPSTPAVASPVAASAATPPSHQPSQASSYTAAADWLHTNSPVSGPGSPRKVSTAGGTFLRTLMLAVLAVGMGAAAHVGYDRYQARDGEPETEVASLASGDLAAWPRIDPPAIRFADTNTTIETVNGTRELAAHRDLVSGGRITTVTDTDPAGTVNSYEIDIRGDQAFLRTADSSVWAPIEIAQARTIVGDSFQNGVFTVSDIFPAEALPHTVVLESVERQIPLNGIRQDLQAQGPTAAIDGASGDVQPRPRGGVELTAVRHYRVIIDTEAFRLADGSAFETWERQLGGVASPRIEVWVDLDGYVRQLRLENDGTMSRQTLVGGAPVSTRFDIDPLRANEQLAAVPALADQPPGGTPAAEPGVAAEPTLIQDPAVGVVSAND